MNQDELKITQEVGESGTYRDGVIDSNDNMYFIVDHYIKRLTKNNQVDIFFSKFYQDVGGTLTNMVIDRPNNVIWTHNTEGNKIFKIDLSGSIGSNYIEWCTITEGSGSLSAIALANTTDE